MPMEISVHVCRRTQREQEKYRKRLFFDSFSLFIHSLHSGYCLQVALFLMVWSYMLVYKTKSMQRHSFLHQILNDRRLEKFKHRRNLSYKL